MGVTISDSNNIPELKRQLRKLKRSSIEVGVVGGDSEMGTIAGVHEFGASINVTDKMRGWFAANGYPLKKETTEIVIPERSFLRTGFDENVDELVNKVDAFLPDVMSLNINADAFANMVGLELSGKIQKKIRDLSGPANSQMTIDRKGSSNPLIDSGRLVGAIRHEVK